MGLTPAQTAIIKSTIPVLEQHGETITTKFYSEMLTAHPELHAIFNRANQVHFHQPRALAAALYAYASNIDDLGMLTPAVELLCHKHASLFVQPEQYDIVGKYLLEAMQDVLGPAMTPEILEAWHAAYWALADILIGREAQLYELAGAHNWTGFRDFRISRKEAESSEITSFYFEPVDGKELPGFQPGQYISIQTFVPALDTLQTRQYSISDRPNKGYVRISVKKEPGLVLEDPKATRHPGYMSNLLHEARQVGDVVKLSHPFGDFFISEEARDSEKPLVLIGGGVGLTPLMTILNDQVERGTKRPISWIHAARDHNARAFTGHIENIVKEKENVKAVLFTDSDGQSNSSTNGTTNGAVPRKLNVPGNVDLERLSKDEDLYLNDKDTEYFVCGPTGFMLYAARTLQEYGVGRDRIHMELFGTGGTPKV